METIIKFKGQLVDGGGKWIFGNTLIQNTAGTKWIASNIAPSKLKDENYYEVVHVCQFSTFSDSFENEIYNNDVLYDPVNKLSYKVQFVDGDFYAVDLDGGEDYELFELLEHHKIKVIGNIYSLPYISMESFQ